MKTTTTIAQSAEWSNICEGDFSDEEWEYLLNKAVKRFNELATESGYAELYWCPYTSSVIGYAHKDYDNIDLDELRQDAWDFENDFEDEEIDE